MRELETKAESDGARRPGLRDDEAGGGSAVQGGSPRGADEWRAEVGGLGTVLEVGTRHECHWMYRAGRVQLCEKHPSNGSPWMYVPPARSYRIPTHLSADARAACSPGGPPAYTHSIVLASTRHVRLHVPMGRYMDVLV